MPETDFITALGRLLSNAALRQKFREDAVGLAHELAISGDDRAHFLSLDPNQLEAQAHTLVQKRLRMVREILPQLFQDNGSEIARHFRQYAQANWPSGHTRHWQDATDFVRHLASQGIGTQANSNRLQFALLQQRLQFHLVNDATIRGCRRRSIQMLYRQGNRIKELHLYLSI